MKFNFIIIVFFCAVLIFAYSTPPDDPIERIGTTQLNGDGCVCHSFLPSPEVMVWVEGPDSLAPSQTALYRMYLAGGPAEAGGYNVASRFGTLTATDSLSFWDPRDPNELTQAFPLVFPTPEDTIFWEFAYNAPDTILTDTIYSVGLSIVYDGIPDSLDIWDFGPKFPVRITDNVVPVELVSFNVNETTGGVRLNWITSSEVNNKGFAVQRKKEQEIQWSDISFINGAITTANTQNYSFVDKDAGQGNIYYRLKQIDLDGSYAYSKVVEIQLSALSDYTLTQNYPNPFNPSTSINYQLPADSYVKIIIYDLLGREVTTLVNENQPAGDHTVEFNAVNLSSGLYFYKLEAKNNYGEVFSKVRKMILSK